MDTQIIKFKESKIDKENRNAITKNDLETFKAMIELKREQLDTQEIIQKLQTKNKFLKSILHILRHKLMTAIDRYEVLDDKYHTVCIANKKMEQTFETVNEVFNEILIDEKQKFKDLNTQIGKEREKWQQEMTVIHNKYNDLVKICKPVNDTFKDQ